MGFHILSDPNVLLLGKKKLKNMHLAGGINTETCYLFLLWRAIRRVHGTSVSVVLLGIGFLNLCTINILDRIMLCWGEEEASGR